jgi:[ribosomal protein S5]-alanine N-acetyltransferase
MKLTTERLILREPRMTDWKDVIGALGDIEVSKNMMKVPHPFTKKDSVAWIKKNIEKWKKKDKEDYGFFIELKSEKKVIGGLKLDVDKPNMIGHTGSWINRKYWKNGYVTEAKTALNEFAFNSLKLRKLEASAFTDNTASNIMQKKMGYTYEGRRAKSLISKATGKIHDVNLYGMLKEEWKKVMPKLKKHLKEKISKLEK